MATKFKGGRSARRLVRNIEPAMRAELVAALEEGGTELYRAIYARAPQKTGKLKAAIERKVYPKTLRLRVGFLGRGKGSRTTVFYARILEFGRKAQTVPIKRGPRAGATMNVGPIAPRKFVYGPLTDIRRVMGKRLRDVWTKVLKKAAVGAGND